VNDRLRLRFWAQTGMALISGVILLMTVLWRDWVEIVFGVDPDSHSGSLEWLIVAVALAVTVSTVALAAREWRRSAALR
jgi:hypothetical protein